MDLPRLPPHTCAWEVDGFLPPRAFPSSPKGILSVKAFACFFMGNWRNPILPDKGRVSITVAHHCNASPSLWPHEGEICSDQATCWSLLHPPLSSPPCPGMLFIPYIFCTQFAKSFSYRGEKKESSSVIYYGYKQLAAELKSLAPRPLE